MASFTRSINLILAALLAAAVASAAAAPSPGDGDGDGVPDDRDECPYSGAGEKVNAEGCSTSVDADGDGIPDRSDLCPYSTAGVKVDSTGCAIDEDMDGVANAQDQCPNTPFGEKVDARGCEIVIPASKRRGVAKKDEPVPVTKLTPSTGPAKVIVKTNPNYVDENELFAAPPPRAAQPAADAVVAPPAPAKPAASIAAVPAQPGEAVIVQVKPSREVEPASPAPAALAPVVPTPAADAPAAVRQPVEAVIIQVKPSREIEPASPAPAAPVAASAAKAVSVPVAVPVAPVPAAATSIPAPVVSAVPARREPVVAPKVEEPKVVLTPEELRANAEQRATMSPASTDRTPSLPKSATVTLPVPSLPADQFPPGYKPNRTAPPVSVPAAAVPGPAANTNRKLPVTGIPVSPGTAVQTPGASAAPAVAAPVAPRAPVTPETVPAVPVPPQSVPAASVRAAVPVIAVAPAGDASPRVALPPPPPLDRDSGAETLAEISFAAGSAQLSPAATQRVRELSSTISSRLSNSFGLVLRLAGYRHAGESAEAAANRGLALRKAFIAEGIDDSRIRIVVIDGPNAATGDFQAAVQLRAE